MVTIALLLLQTLVWSAVYLTGDAASWTALMLIPGQFSFVSLLTAPFVHLSVGHLGANLVLTWLLGRPLERSVGALPFLLLYVGAAVFAGLLHLSVVLIFQLDARTYAFGASGAVAGLMGAYAVRFSHHHLRMPFLSRPLLSVHAALLLWLVVEVLQAVASMRRHEAFPMGHWAHVGGFIFGLTVAQGMGVGRTAAVERALAEARQGQLPEVQAQEAMLALLGSGKCSDGEIAAILDSAGGISGAQRAVEEWLEARVAEGRLEVAVPVYRQVMHRWSDTELSVGARYALGRRLAAQREWRLALVALATAGHDDPHDDTAAEALVRAGEIAAGALGDATRAAALFTAAQERQSEGIWRQRATEGLARLVSSKQ
jgi:membrane associated rhomboid family serine protease